MRFLIILVLAVACAVSTRAAATPEKQLKAFITAARDTISKQPASSGGNPSLSRPQIDVPSVLDRLEHLPAPLTLEAVQGYVAQVTFVLSSSEKIRKTGDELITTLTADHDQRLARYRAEVDTLLGQSAQACLAATSPRDLDHALSALAPYQRPDDQARQGGVDISAQQRAVRMLQFVTRWQDYLGAVQAGDGDRARQAVYELKNLADPAWIPRSKLFDLSLGSESGSPQSEANDSRHQAWAKLKPLLVRLGKVTRIGELQPFVQELNEIVAAIPDYPPLRDIQRQVISYLADRKALENGQINTRLFSTNDSVIPQLDNPLYSPEIIAVFQNLRVQLQRETLAWVFQDSGLPQKNGESTDAYIQRIAKAAAAAENWEYTLRTLEFYQAVFPANLTPAWTARELASCSSYVAGRRLDEAGLFPQAIVAYQDALRATGELTPLKLIAARLADFKVQHPEAFEAAAQRPRVIYQPAYGYPSSFNPPAPPDYLVPRTEHPFKP